MQTAKDHFKYPQGLRSFTVVQSSTKSLVQQGISYKRFCTRFYISFSPRLVVCIDMNVYIYLQKILKRNYAMHGTVLTYLLKYKKRWTWLEHDIDSVVNGVCIHYTLMKLQADLMNTLQFKQMMSLTVLICNIRFFLTCFLWGRQVSYKPWWLQNNGKHWNKVKYWL